MAGSSRAPHLLVSIALALLLSLTALSTALAQDSDVSMIVTYTEGQGARLREAPSTTAAVVTVIPEGTRVQVAGDVIRADGRTWRKVRDADGHTGYVASDFLLEPSDVSATPAPATTASPPTRAPFTGTLAPYCTDVRLRFPGALDPERAMKNAMSDIGFNPYAHNPFIGQVIAAAPKVVGTWIGISLSREWRGYPPITLSQWLRFQRISGYVINEQDFLDIATWPINTCEGAFVQHPDNYDIMMMVMNSGLHSRPSRMEPAPVPHQPQERINCDSPETKVRLDDVKWSIGSDGYLHATATVTSLCDHTIYVRGAIDAVTSRGTEIGVDLSGLKLSPRSTFTYPDLDSGRAIRDVISVRTTLEGLDCPEMVC